MNNISAFKRISFWWMVHLLKIDDDTSVERNLWLWIGFQTWSSIFSIRLLQELANEMIPATLKFIRQDNGVTPALLTDLSPLDCQPTVIGLQEMTSFLSLLSILLDKTLIKENSPELKCKSNYKFIIISTKSLA